MDNISIAENLIIEYLETQKPDEYHSINSKIINMGEPDDTDLETAVLNLHGSGEIDVINPAQFTDSPKVDKIPVLRTFQVKRIHL